ncbi:tRNA dimethylallyltransferase [Iodidimonas gelatinilytica]|uniref:tRNA dimethylallyltransferase n=1 Tax=Iodidimonas gelatinilytica TaxID=1236966 RepID=A0A5A7MPB7_9PROT|nr:tRNA (adenosine(37)-N6)-dimethylallyltransferase MiaA [Iodidimonas gelatinilytica]GEQ97872.1 tRNA dimethylallyltransferase [Iodidimonas gelatinilytica]
MSTSAVLIAGPTASGKSSLAVAIAQRHKGVVINADSMQVYKDLHLLSARPSESDQGGVPHKLFGVLDGAELCSAARWHDLAMAEVSRAWEQGCLPILVGGTGLYIRTLLEGLAPVPDIPDAVRDAVRSDMAARGPQALHEDLASLDPAMAQKLEPGDSQRIARALEVVRATGQSLSDFQKTRIPGGLSEADKAGHVLKLALMPERAMLYARTDQRFIEMMAQGALEEVRQLAQRGLDPALPVMKALGVPALVDYLAGSIDKATAIDLAQRQTRNYAKRQMTWLRTQCAGWQRFDGQDRTHSLATVDHWIEQREKARGSDNLHR